MTFQEGLKLIGRRASQKQHAAARYLESRGLRFFVHFGTQNVRTLAREAFERSRVPYQRRPF